MSKKTLYIEYDEEAYLISCKGEVSINDMVLTTSTSGKMI